MKIYFKKNIRGEDNVPALNIKYPCPLSCPFSSTYICNLGLLRHVQTSPSKAEQLVCKLMLKT